jgi:hypothetical protein
MLQCGKKRAVLITFFDEFSGTRSETPLFDRPFAVPQRPNRNAKAPAGASLERTSGSTISRKSVRRSASVIVPADLLLGIAGTELLRYTSNNLTGGPEGLHAGFCCGLRPGGGAAAKDQANQRIEDGFDVRDGGQYYCRDL